MHLRAFCFASIVLACTGHAQTYDQKLYDALQWRCIGPFRGGRTVGAAGHPSQPNVFYIGVNNGGVWKTTDFGHTWKPIFDDQPTGSIGTVSIAPSDPNIVYVGSGEGLQRPDLSVGDGIYRSNDAGKTWTHLGLRDAQQITAIAIDPTDANRFFVGSLGHPYGANKERGVYLSADGGKTYRNVLFVDENTGCFQVTMNPGNRNELFADMYDGRQGPWENSSWQGPGSGLYKSTDRGEHWRKITSGLPTTAEGLGRIGFCYARSNPKTMYAVVDADAKHGGIYRSEDAGESWHMVSNEPRTWGRGSDFGVIEVDPKDETTVYVPNTSCYKSTDGGKSFFSWKGAPGGDDYHSVWINPNLSQVILLASDQGATISVNGGDTWSSWYNQPTAQFYHVSTDDAFPYWVYGGQQESGSAGVASRGNDGQITFREWHPVGAEEYGYVAPDPLDRDTVYGGKLQKWNRITGQVQDVSPQVLRSGGYRFLRTAPVLFSKADPHVLFFAGNVLFKTTTGGKTWDIISPDLSREHPDVPESIGIYRKPEMASMARRGVIYTVAPSPLDINIIWAGTDDGLIHLTRDGGKTWKDVTPPHLTSWSKVSIIDAGQSDKGTAYAAVNRIRLDDMRPHIFRTHDYGVTWVEVVNGLPKDAPVNSVKEDPIKKGLLFAGTERDVWFSTDDGDHWNPLRLNMPATSIRDLVVHESDLVVGTHGRSFWILDDMSPLRDLNSDSGKQPVLNRTSLFYRVRRNTNSDTPLPPEEPAGKNPPDGAILNYYLPSNVQGEVSLEIVDSQGKVVRKFSSEDPVTPIDEKSLQVPMYWIRQPKALPKTAGSHRWVWDLRYAPPPGGRGYPISAIYGDTPPVPEGPLAMPGEFKVRLTVDGKTLEQKLLIYMDPRVYLEPGALSKQFEVAKWCYDRMADARKMIGDATAAKAAGKNVDDLLAARGDSSIAAFSSDASTLMNRVEEADAMPTQPMLDAYEALKKRFADLQAKLQNVIR